MKEKTTLYHVNTHAKVNNLIDNNELNISVHESDNQYTGTGMYFWDNKGNANYWLGEKLKHESKKNLCLLVISAEYSTDELLDLMDYAQEKEYQNILSRLSKIGVFSGKTLGEKVDYLCDYLGCKLVRSLTYYPGTPQTNLLEQSRVTNKSKVIYCIKPGHYDIIKSKHKEVFQ
jgi:hypothetical protein